MPNPTHHRRLTAALLAAITAIGAGLRFYGLEIQSLWNDELSSWMVANHPGWLDVVAHVAPEHPPGFILFMHFWDRFVGDSEMLLRLPAAIAGTLAIPATFLLGRKLYRETEGLIAAALMAVLWMPVYYSQEARANIMIMLFATLSTYWLIDIAGALLRRDTAPITAVVGYIATATAACYAHYFGLFFIVLQGAFTAMIVLAGRGAWLRLVAIYAVVVLLYAPWLWRATTVLTSGTPGWLAPPNPAWLWDLACFMFNQSDEVALAFAGLGAVALAVAAWRARSETQPIRRALFSPTAMLVLWVVIPVVTVYLRSVYVAPAFTSRNFIVVAPALYLLAARAMTSLPLPRAVTYVGVCGLIASLLVHLLFVKDYYERPTKDQFRQVAAYLVARDDPAAVVVVLAAAWSPGYFNYYLERLGSPRRVDRIAIGRNDAEAAIRLVDEKAPDQIWFLAAHRIPDDRLIDTLKKRFRLTDERRFYFGHAWRFRYERKPATHW